MKPAERGEVPAFVDLDSKSPSPYRLLPTLPGALQFMARAPADT